MTTRVQTMPDGFHMHTLTFGPNWQPVDENTPRDGRAILAALRYRDGRIVEEPMTIRWHEPWGQWVMSGCLIGIQNNAKDEENVDPYAWMPAPQPPRPLTLSP